MLFDVPRRSVLSQVSFLLPCEQNPAQAVNGIDPVLTRQPQPWQQGLKWFEALLASADLMVAHNAAFDRQWFGIAPLPPVDALLPAAPLCMSLHLSLILFVSPSASTPE